MIAICIPVYNFDVRQLISELKQQMLLAEEVFELIVIDDGSKNFYREMNREVMSQLTYLELANNIGRSAIRNKFLELTNAQYLLFLDCDAIIHQTNFLNTYREFVVQKNDVNIVCGGRVYPDKCPSPQQQLRWKYGLKRESQSAEARRLVPNQSFMTNNFLLKRSVLEAIRFDESLNGYGHEDTLFGIELEKQGIFIEHIENPVLNGDIETNEVFLEKTRQAVLNLAQIYQISSNADKQFLVERVPLLKIYRKTRLLHFMFRLFYRIFGAVIERHLNRKGTSLFLFQLYKLGILLFNESK